MKTAYKRILTVKSEQSSEFLMQAFDQFHGSMARPGRGVAIGEYVIEVPDSPYWRQFADRLVEQYDTAHDA
jgi:hypothetical protein